jgi:hypothetical protein
MTLILLSGPTGENLRWPKVVYLFWQHQNIRPTCSIHGRTQSAHPDGISLSSPANMLYFQDCYTLTLFSPYSPMLKRVLQ